MGGEEWMGNCGLLRVTAKIGNSELVSEREKVKEKKK